MSKKLTARRRKRIWVSVLVALALIFYFGSYLYFRINHTFIHRAGYYRYDSRRDVEIDTNHYIEPATVADGPQIFATAALALAVVGAREMDFDSPEFDQILREGCSQVFEKERRRWKLFTFYKPAAMIETLIWKIIEPNPEIPR
ncbi:MAG: hypothetical protein KDM91_14930 [Verrucomicrobiae bacterium]|nr:hypothetical protein [Verrucomicrobiae bacterium]